MITKYKLRKLCETYTNGMGTHLTDVYRQFAMKVMVEGTVPTSLFDYTACGGIVGNALATHGIECLRSMVSVSGSDFAVQGDSLTLAKLGALQCLAVMYYVDKSGEIKTQLATSSIDVVRSLIAAGGIKGVDKILPTDNSFKKAVGRCSVPTSSTKTMNVYKSALYGYKTNEPTYCGINIRLEEVDKEGNMSFSYTSSNALPMKDVLFVPLYFYFILEDIFNEQFRTDEGRGTIDAAVSESVVKSPKLISYLAAGQSTEGVWQKFGKNRDHFLTASSKVITAFYGGKKTPSQEVKDKVLYGKRRLGLDITKFRFGFYDLQGALNSVEMSKLDPLTFLQFREYTAKDFQNSRKLVSNTAKIPPFILSSVYRESVEQLFDKKVDAVDLWNALNIPAEILESKFGDEHKRYCIGASKFSTIELYRIMTENKGVFGNVDARIAEKMKTLGIADKQLKRVNLSEDVYTRANELKEALSKGICVITYAQGSNTSKHIVTTNPKVLMAVYGVDYVARYESKSSRIKSAKYLVAKAKSTSDLQFALRTSGVWEFASEDNLIPPIVENFEVLRDSIVQFLDAIPVKTRDVAQNPTLIFSKSLAATPKLVGSEEGSKDFIKTFKAENVEMLQMFN